MARGNDGNEIKYIYLDTDFFDKEKIFLIEKFFGYEGIVIAIRLLLWIACREGWGVKWGETGPAYFAKCGIGDPGKEKRIKEIVTKLVEIGYFDAGAYQAGFLTSKRIIKDWKRTIKACHREIILEDIPEYIARMINGEKRENNEKPREECANFREDCANDAENIREDCAKFREECANNSENFAVDKIRLDIYSPTARARTREGSPPGETADKTYTDEERAQAEKMISLWNEITKGTDREFTDFYPPEMLIARIIDRIRQEPKEEIWRRVFTNARDEPFPWTLPAVFNKPDNFNQLKIKIKKPKETATAGRADRFGSDRPGFGKADYYD